jgi:hypothetical protein
MAEQSAWSVAGVGHYLLDEKPAEATTLIERYASIGSSKVP